MRDITAAGTKLPSAAALGFFDGLHLGHIEVIKRALLQDGLKSVIFTFNDKTALPKFSSEKGERIITYEQKTELFAKTGADYLYAADFGALKDYSAREFAEKILRGTLSAAYVVCGYDFRFGRGGEGSSETLSALCGELGIRCEVVPPVKADGEIVSSTVIRALIRSGDIEKANRLLGYELSYVLPVVRGNAIGRTIGFPTINQNIPEYMVCPKRGVYKSWAVAGGRTFRGITNIGVKPTVTDCGKTVMETHIIGFDGDLYGQNVKISLRGFLRDEVKFAGLDELKKQLSYDKSVV